MRITAGDAAFDRSVAEWVLLHFPEFNGRYNVYKAVAFLDEQERICGALIMTDYKGFDADLSIYAPGVAWDRTTLKALFDWAFNQLGLSRLTVRIEKKNKVSRRFVERIGWRLEGVIRKGYDGKRDACIYGLLKGDCKFL